MGKYKENINWKPYSFINATLVIDDVYPADGVESFQVEMDEDETEVQAAADGAAILIVNPIHTGIIQFTALESSPSTDVMFDALESGNGIKLAFADVNAPNLDVLGENGLIVKRPIIGRSKEVKMLEWNVKYAYLNPRGGSFALREPA